MSIITVGIDLAKNGFAVHGVDEDGEAALVWIDYFLGTQTTEAKKLDCLLSSEPIAIGDLILTEVLQGFGSERNFNEAKRLLTSLLMVELGGQDVAIQPVP